MDKKTGLLTFLAGALIGSTASILFAPRSGEETRQILLENSQEIKEKAMKSIEEVQESALSTLEEAQARAEAINNEAKQRLAKLRELESTSEIEFESKQEQPESEEALEHQSA